MAEIIQFPKADIVTQDELADLERALHVKVLADGDFMRLNGDIMARIEKGARIEAGQRSYHRNLGCLLLAKL